MQIDLTPCFTPEELPLATRLIASRSKRLAIESGLLLRAYIRDLVFDEAGRSTLDLTEEAVAAAESRTTITAESRIQESENA